MLAEHCKEREDYQSCLLLAVNLAGIAHFVADLQLFVGIENPIRSGLFLLKAFVRLHQRAGFLFIELNMCMFDLIHPVTQLPVWKGLKLLTNAPWMMGLGIRCDESHAHTQLTGAHTTWSAAYTWKFSVCYAKLLKTAKTWLSIFHMNMPVQFRTPHYKTVSSLAITRFGPDAPLTYLAGELDVIRRRSVDFDDMMAPIRVDPETNPTAAAEAEEEFALMCKWLSELKIPAVKVEHQQRRDGEELFMVTFGSPIFDIRDFREKATLHFQAYGKNHVRKWGIEKASAMASRVDEGKVRFGCGIVKWNGHRGNGANEFWCYDVSNFN